METVVKPRGFFHVAVDLPGHGMSAGSPTTFAEQPQMPMLKYARSSLTEFAAFAGHASMKHVWIVDSDIDITNPQAVEWAMATRFQGDKGIVVKTGVKGSSLDPSSNPETRETVKVGFDCTIPLNRDKEDFIKPKPAMQVKLEDYLD